MNDLFKIVGDFVSSNPDLSLIIIVILFWSAIFLFLHLFKHYKF